MFEIIFILSLLIWVTWEDLKSSLILAISSHSQLILTKFAKYRGTTAMNICFYYDVSYLPFVIWIF